MNHRPRAYLAGHILRDQNNCFSFARISRAIDPKRDGGEWTDTVYEWRIKGKKLYVGHTSNKVKSRHTSGGQHIASLNDSKKPRRQMAIDIMDNHKTNKMDVFAYDLSKITLTFFGEAVTPREALERALRTMHKPPLNRTKPK